MEVVGTVKSKNEKKEEEPNVDQVQFLQSQ
jgi:hypothetical protein